MHKRIPDLEKGAAVMRQEPPAVTVGVVTVVTNHSCGKRWNSELHYYYYYYYYTEECLNFVFYIWAKLWLTGEIRNKGRQRAKKLPDRKLLSVTLVA